MIHIRGVWPGGGSVWRGFPAVGDTLTLPACVGQGLLRRRSCGRAQPHRCSPVRNHVTQRDSVTEYISEMNYAIDFSSVAELHMYTKAAETLILTFRIILEASKWCGCIQCVFIEHICLIQKTLIVVTKRHNVAMEWDTHSVYSVQYFIPLVRNFPRVAKAGGVLGHNSTHCGEVICGTKTQIGYWGTAKVCEH